MFLSRFAVLSARECEDIIRRRSRSVQLNSPALRVTVAQCNLDPIMRQQTKALIGPFYGSHSLAGEIFDQSCRFKLANRANTIQIHMGKRQTPLVFVNHYEGRAGHRCRRCAKTLGDSANKRCFARSERSVKRDRFSSAERTTERLT
jgi:hypothetical protein